MLAELARLDGVIYVMPTGAITRTQAMRGQVAELHRVLATLGESEQGAA
jgi:hypothetical protein